MTTLPDVTASLAAGGLKPDDIDYVVYSHVSLRTVLKIARLIEGSRFTGITLGSLAISPEALS